MSSANAYPTATDSEVPRSITDSLSQLSVLNIFGWFALFAVVTVGSVYLMNCFMKYREAQAQQEPEVGELAGLVQARGAPAGHAKEENNEASCTEGSSSRRNFLQQRREAAQKTYGTAQSVGVNVN
ncbi:hypothetical protein STCU_10884 [Strigomonas culicis]|uniref:Transmembrane protein n=1 Tax=Strigomonas culicis TaxID=28005 RepID=S9TJE8_9TRYP|nr:hypothetical protein STCU_10884 [Strigomonas culicis]|eukprot:EPY16979.1 hypothetical protein STCU_10884 [Strigomonas culicis]